MSTRARRTYPRWAYVAVLSAAVGALMFAAGTGDRIVVWLSYVVAVGLGGVVFYQDEASVTPGPIVANVAVALVIGTGVALLAVAGLLIVVLGVPWDLALWRGSLRVWSAVVGVGFALTTAFFLVGAVASLQ